MKITVIGGGSTYTPELADGLGRLAPWVTEVVLVDPDEARLAGVGQVSARIMRAHGHPATVRWTTNADDGLDGAAAVLIQLRIGGQAARHRDETWPLEYGCVGQETTGAGGLAKALRTVPAVLGISERARGLAPDAWLIDFTNPVGIVTRALLDAGHRAVGLCNVAIGLQRFIAAALNVDPARVSLGHAGLNHLTWVRGVELDGNQILPDLLASHGEELASRSRVPRSVIRELEAVPSYYLRYFYFHDTVVGEQRQRETRAAEVAAIEKELLGLYADPALDHKPALLARRGGAFYSEAAVALIASLFGDGGADTQVVNLRNSGTLPFLPDEAVVEVPAVVTASGASAVPVQPFTPGTRGLIAHVSAYEELALDAALRGGRFRVVAALLAHPLIGQYDLAEKMADRLLAENAQFLPWATAA